MIMRIQELGHIVLYVTNLEKVSRFYRETLGFREIANEGPLAAFSSGRTHHELLLIEIGGQPKEVSHKATPGLCHIGFKVGNSKKELKKIYKELQKKGVPIVGTADHFVTNSIYVLDPDGNELELYVDVSDDWKKDPKSVMKPIQSLDLE